MKSKILASLVLGLSLVAAAKAQLTLNNFSSFASPQTLFYGDWSNTGDPFSGSTSATATFSQGAGYYNFSSAMNVDSAFVEYSFSSAVNITSASQLSLSLRLLSDNTADSVTVFLFDSSARSAFATFLTSDFNATTFSEHSLAFTADAGFAFNDVSLFRISGNDPFASGVFSVAIDNLSVNVSTGSAAVPEPSTYGLLGVLLLGVGVLARKSSKTKIG